MSDAEPNDPHLGATLGGRYAVVRLLGEGGMGRVYEGRHTVIGKRVAIKVMHAAFAADADNVRRFVNEARAAATLQHPHIIDASDVGTTGEGEPFIVLEFLEGRDLESALDEDGPMPVARATRIVRQVAAAIGAAHAQGIIHRDLKPQNVFLVRRGEDPDFVKVLDFGISKFLDAGSAPMTQANITLGTPAYMAPEQIVDSRSADARADVYAAGVMLYRMLAGAMPFTADSFADLLLKKMGGQCPSIREYRPALPEGLASAIGRAMAPAPTARFRSMAELETALAPWESHHDPDDVAVSRVQPREAPATVTGTVGRPAPASPDGSPSTRVFPRGESTGGPPPTVAAARPARPKEPPATVAGSIARRAPESNPEPPSERTGADARTAAPPETVHHAPVASSAAEVWPAPAVLPTPGKRACPHCGTTIGRETECAECGGELRDLRIGETLAERYRVEKLLGAGGMGRVYLGTQLSFNEPVAIKFLLSEWTARSEFRTRFRREAMTLAKLRHPGIVTVHDHGEHEGELYMVMEFVKGRALRDVVGDGEALPVPRALGLLDLVLQTIEYAHAQGIVHRDLKPDNVMMLELGERVERVKVLDFGLALATDTVPAERLTATLAVQGTPTYMSPEQCRGRDVGPPTDVYALGVMLFEWLTGAVPFGAGSFSETLAQQMFKDPPRMADVGTRPNVPAAVEALVRAALAKDPASRPDAIAFRERIAQILRGDDPVTAAERAARERSDAAMATRDERSRMTAAGGSASTSASPPAVTGRVIVWGAPDARATELGTHLAVNGCSAMTWSEGAPPPVVNDPPAVKAAIVQWTPDVSARIEAIRARVDLAKIAVIVLDAPDVDATPTLIRAGATDVVYKGAAADAVCKQTLKLMKRVK